LAGRGSLRYWRGLRVDRSHFVGAGLVTAASEGNPAEPLGQVSGRGLGPRLSSGTLQLSVRCSSVHFSPRCSFPVSIFCAFEIDAVPGRRITALSLAAGPASCASDADTEAMMSSREGRAEVWGTWGLADLRRVLARSGAAAAVDGASGFASRDLSESRNKLTPTQHSGRGAISLASPAAPKITSAASAGTAAVEGTTTDETTTQETNMMVKKAKPKTDPRWNSIDEVRERVVVV
jgi:hypothetical protein